MAGDARQDNKTDGGGHEVYAEHNCVMSRGSEEVHGVGKTSGK